MRANVAEPITRKSNLKNKIDTLCSYDLGKTSRSENVQIKKKTTTTTTATILTCSSSEQRIP